MFVCQAALGEDEDEVPKLPPMFITEFVLDTAQLTFLPDEEEFQDKIAEVIKQFQVYNKLSLVMEGATGVIANCAVQLAGW